MQCLGHAFGCSAGGGFAGPSRTGAAQTTFSNFGSYVAHSMPRALVKFNAIYVVKSERILSSLLSYSIGFVFEQLCAEHGTE